MTWVNLNDVYVNKTGGTITGDLAVNGNLTINGATGNGTTYNVANEISTLRDSVSQDYIVKQGASGIWFYRKWNSGLAEFFGGKQFSGTGSVIIAPTTFPFTLTSLLYKSASVIYDAGNKAMFIVSGSGANISTSDTGVYVAKQDVTDSSSTQTGRIEYDIKGLWK